jgi:hypothetical protein
MEPRHKGCDDERRFQPEEMESYEEPMTEASAPCLEIADVDATEPPVHDVKRQGSYELKFLLADSLADVILGLARTCLAPDPHADQTLGDGYRVNSLYFDTADLDVYHRFGSFGRRKYRLRRYGSESRVFLERKSKSCGLVTKRRTAIPESELVLLDTFHHGPYVRENAELIRVDGSHVHSDWSGWWFHRRLAKRQLEPKAQISYERVARMGITPEGVIRFTVDRHIRCRAASGLAVPSLADGTAILAGQSIVEFKFRVAMPALFKNLIHEFSLSPSSVSKYRLSVEESGLNNGHKSSPVGIGARDVAAGALDESVRYA